jgi:hypothetical protein
VLKWRSISNIVRAPARTGRAKTRRNPVISTLHTKRGIDLHDKPDALMQKIVTIKLIAPNKELKPDTCKL